MGSELPTDIEAVQWGFKSEAHDPGGISIVLMRSPFYDGGRYSVRKPGCVLNVNGDEWIYEPKPSSRDEAFYENYRFKNFDAAVEAARKHL